MGVKVTDGLRTVHRVKVHVWELPVRIFHWLLVGSIAVLAISGIVIANANMGLLLEHPTGMNLNRAIHTGAGYIFVVALVGRLVWMFTGNRYVRLDQFAPVSEERRIELKNTAKYYTFLMRGPISEAGHNPLAGTAYLVMYGLFVVQGFTGLAFVGMDNQGGLVWNMTHWLFAYVDIPVLRFIHHAIMWIIAVFLVQHLYSMVLVDIEENSGIVSSMITGVKILPIEEETIAEEEEEHHLRSKRSDRT